MASKTCGRGRSLRVVAVNVGLEMEPAVVVDPRGEIHDVHGNGGLEPDVLLDARLHRLENPGTALLQLTTISGQDQRVIVQPLNAAYS